MTKLTRTLVLGCSIMAIAACGPEEIASPGTGGNVTIINEAPPPAPTPTPTPTQALVTPAGGCPTLIAGVPLAEDGLISGPTGTWRVCSLPLNISSSTSLPYIPGLLYRLAGQTLIGTDQGADSTGNNVTLSIEPGVIVYAAGSSYLAATRGNRLNAVGTADRPIVFTSRDNVLGINGENSSSQWGGLVLLGRGQVVDCEAQGATPGTNGCEFALEGSAAPAFGGGTTNDDNSGRIEFVQIRFSGFILGSDNELQGLTTVGAGSGTVFNNIQSVNSSDDGVEFFGGSVNMKKLIVYGAEDDSLDVDVGVQGQLQHVILSQRPFGATDALVEGDSSNGKEDQLPRTNVVVANATMIKRSNGSAGLRLRGGMDFTLVNSVVIDQSSGSNCVRLDDSQTVRAADAALQDKGPPVFASVAFQCPTLTANGSKGGTTAAETAAFITGGTGNNTSFVNTLTAGYLNGASENGYTPIFNVASLSDFFTPTSYIGAVTASDNWTQGWTCNMALLNFGAGNSGSCLTLPVYPAAD